MTVLYAALVFGAARAATLTILMPVDPTAFILPPTPYPELNDILRILVEGVHDIVGDGFVGAYLQGSFAVGDFDEHSDVDFIVAVRDELTEPDVLALQGLHARIHGLKCTWGQHLEGSYVPVAILRDHRLAGAPVWYLDHGSTVLIRSDHCNTALVRWVVREWGVPLAGPLPSTLVDPIPVADLRREIIEVMHHFGRELMENPARYRNRFYLAFIVHTYSRMLHDLVEGRPGSKRSGTAWAKAHLDPKWSALIDRSWAGRANPDVSVRELPDAADFESALSFVRYVMAESARRGFTLEAYPPQPTAAL
jgi:hypothetical protein